MVPEADFDGPWKEALDRYLPECLALLLPEVHAAVDWSREVTSLDTELQRIAPESTIGRRVVDKLVRVWRRDGEEAWVLIHIEVQNQEERDFERRMYGYFSRLLDHFDRPVVSVAILGDERPTWRPRPFQFGLWGCEVVFRFPFVKLLDLLSRWDELEASTNPFAGIVMAHLRALETRDDAARRGVFKFALVRWLLARRYSREETRRVFRFIDWIMLLPKEAEREFWDTVRVYEEAQPMAYITSIERIGIEKGIEQGREQGLREGREEGRRQGRQEGRQEGQRAGLLMGLEQLLPIRFGAAGEGALEEIKQVHDLATLEAIVRRVRSAASIEEIRAIYAPGRWLGRQGVDIERSSRPSKLTARHGTIQPSE